MAPASAGNVPDQKGWMRARASSIPGKAAISAWKAAFSRPAKASARAAVSTFHTIWALPERLNATELPKAVGPSISTKLAVRFSKPFKAIPPSSASAETPRATVCANASAGNTGISTRAFSWRRTCPPASGVAGKVEYVILMRSFKTIAVPSCWLSAASRAFASRRPRISDSAAWSAAGATAGRVPENPPVMLPVERANTSAYISGEERSPGNVKRATGPMLYFSPTWSATTPTDISPGPLEVLPGTDISAGMRNIKPSGVSNRVFSISRTGETEKSFKTVMVPLAFSCTFSVPSAATTAESSSSVVCTVYGSVPIAAVCAGYAL